MVQRTHFHAIAMYANEFQPRVGKSALTADALKHGADSTPVADAVATVDESGKKWALALINRPPDHALVCTRQAQGPAVGGHVTGHCAGGRIARGVQRRAASRPRGAQGKDVHLQTGSCRFAAALRGRPPNRPVVAGATQTSAPHRKSGGRVGPFDPASIQSFS